MGISIPEQKTRLSDFPPRRAPGTFCGVLPSMQLRRHTTTLLPWCSALGRALVLLCHVSGASGTKTGAAFVLTFALVS